MEKRKAIPVGELITTWNHVCCTAMESLPRHLTNSSQLFFHPRRMEVVLAKGQLSSMGHKNSIPDLPKRQSNCSSSSCSSLSSSSSSASSSSDGHWDGQGKGEREVYKADRKARKAERKIHRAERKKYNKEKEVHRKQERQQRKAERKHAKIEAKNDKKYKLLVLALYPGSEAACPGEHMYSQ